MPEEIHVSALVLAAEDRTVISVVYGPLRQTDHPGVKGYPTHTPLVSRRLPRFRQEYPPLASREIVGANNAVKSAMHSLKKPIGKLKPPRRVTETRQRRHWFRLRGALLPPV